MGEVAEALFPDIRLARLEQDFPLPVVAISPEHDEAKRIEREAADLVLAGDFDAVLARVRDQMQSRATTMTCQRHYEEIIIGLYRGINVNDESPPAADRVADKFRKWAALNPGDPDIAALAARVLQLLAHIHRGEDWAHKTCRCQPAPFWFTPGPMIVRPGPPPI